MKRLTLADRLLRSAFWLALGLGVAQIAAKNVQAEQLDNYPRFRAVGSWYVITDRDNFEDTPLNGMMIEDTTKEATLGFTCSPGIVTLILQTQTPLVADGEKLTAKIRFDRNQVTNFEASPISGFSDKVSAIGIGANWMDSLSNASLFGSELRNARVLRLRLENDSVNRDFRFNLEKTWDASARFNRACAMPLPSRTRVQSNLGDLVPH